MTAVSARFARHSFFKQGANAAGAVSLASNESAPADGCRRLATALTKTKPHSVDLVFSEDLKN